MRRNAPTPRRRSSATTRSSMHWWLPRRRRTSRWSRSTPCRSRPASEQRALLWWRRLLPHLLPLGALRSPSQHRLLAHVSREATAAASHERAQPLPLRARRVGTARVDLLVARHEVGPLRAQPVHEDVAHLASQVKRDAADVRRARLRAQLEDALDLLGRVVDARHERGDKDAARYAGAVQLRDRLDPRAGVGRMRLGRAPRLLLERRDRQARLDRRHPCHLLHEREVAQEERRLREDRARVAEVAERLPDARHELVAPLDPLVRVGVGAEGDVLALPRRPGELAPQYLRDVDLDDYLLLEVAPGVHVEELVRRPREAVVADDAVRDEVAGAGGHVVEGEVDAERLDGLDLQLRVG